MPTWPKANPNHTEFFCSTAWHLKQSARCLAIYSLAGSLTKGGKTPFFAKISKVADYFDWSYEATRKAFHVLRKLGFLEALNQKGYYRYVDHGKADDPDSWAAQNNSQCNSRATLPWQNEVDPLVGKMYAVSGGKLRMMPHQVAALRKYADRDDDLILRLFTAEIENAITARARGFYEGNSANTCRYRVFANLKQTWLQKQNEQNEQNKQISR